MLATALAGPSAGAVGGHRAWASEPRITPTRTFRVNTTTDAPATSAALSGGRCADSTGRCSLRAAVQAADALGDPVAIDVAAGTYTLSDGPLLFTDPAGMSITGAGASQTVVSGDEENRVGVVEEAADAGSGGTTRGSLASLAAITLQGGLAPSTGVLSGQGGALAVADANDVLELTKVSIVSSAANEGGGIADAGQVWGSGDLFSGDTAGQGGAVATAGGASGTSITITTSEFSGDSADTGSSPVGGAIAASGGALAVSNTSFVHDLASGSAPQGGAIAGTAGERVVLSGDLFSQDGAHASSGQAQGGAVFTGPDATASVTRSDFSDDTAQSGAGGGLFNAGITTVSSTTFVNNAASGSGGDGGAAYNSGDLTVASSSFIKDTVSGAAAQGGGLFSSGLAGVSGTSFTRDGASGAGAQGGGVYTSGTITLSYAVLSRDTVTGAGAGGGGLASAGVGEVSGTTFGSDSATGSGGGYALGGGVLNTGTLTLTGGSFTSDSARDGGGGGLADAGGGGAVSGASFRADRATGGTPTAGAGAGFGGAIYAADDMTVTNTILHDNSATVGGGGIYQTQPLTLDASTVSANRARLGAGVFADGATQGSADAIVDNTASGTGAAGGGVLVVGYTGVALGASLELSDSVIAGNVAPTGAGIDDQGGPDRAAGGSVADVVIAANRTPAGREQNCAASGSPAALPLGSAGGNVVGDTTCAFTAAADRRGSSAQGYWLVGTAGSLHRFAVPGFGSVPVSAAARRIVAITPAPGNAGYWELSATGSVRAFGSAVAYSPAHALLRPGHAVALLPTMDGDGYLVVLSTGRVHSYGDAVAHGNPPAGHHIVGAARSVDGRGYWMVSATGRVYAFGDAPHLGSPLGIHAAAIAATPDGRGYWVVSTTGRVHAYGDARSYGSTIVPAGAPVIAVLPSPDGHGYLLVTRSGRVYRHGDAVGHGSAGAPVTAAAAT
jgi:hypothetical protein